MNARTRMHQTTLIAHKLTSRLPKLPAEFATILARLAPSEICLLNSRLDSIEIDDTATLRDKSIGN
jgi:hypothetical protein